jgi:hypothetical protein
MTKEMGGCVLRSSDQFGDVVEFEPWRLAQNQTSCIMFKAAKQESKRCERTLEVQTDLFFIKTCKYAYTARGRFNFVQK